MAALLDIVTKDSTDRSVTIRIVDSTDGTPETAVEHNTSGIDLWYRREGAAKVSITEAALAALTTAHTDGGIEHIGDGEYRLDLPDAAFATGVNYVDVGGTVTGMVVIGGRVRLIDADLEDATRLGLTALPSAAADAAGGLPISDAGGLDLDAKLAATNEVTAARMGALTDWINGGRLDLIIDAILDDTDLIDDGTSGLAKIATDVAAVLVDTNELQTNQNNWLTADVSGLATAANLATVAGYLDTEIAAILADTDELQTNQGNWLTATGFSTHSAADVVNEWETQSQADPTGFHVNVLEVGGTAQTANDNGADINEILTDTGTTLPATLSSISSSLADYYHADVLLTIDEANTQDEYTIQWYLNGAPITSGITSPTIQVVKRADGTDLIASTTPTQIGSTGAYKHDETTGRTTAGEAVIIVVTATIGGSSRTWRVPASRDSTA